MGRVCGAAALLGAGLSAGSVLVITLAKCLAPSGSYFYIANHLQVFGLMPCLREAEG